MENYKFFRKAPFPPNRNTKGSSDSLFWNITALFWEQFFKRFPPHRNLVREIVRKVGEPHSSTRFVLDAGCGPGLLSIELARRGHKVLGIDRSIQMLRRGQRRKQSEKLENLFFLGNDLNASFDDQKHFFYKIIFVHSLYLLENPGKILRKAASVLMEGGEILMCNPSRRLSLAEMLAGGWSFLTESLREKGLLSLFSLLAIAFTIGCLHLVIQYRKKRIYHCWNEIEIEELLKANGLRLKWIQKSCLGNSHLLLCAVREK